MRVGSLLLLCSLLTVGAFADPPAVAPLTLGFNGNTVIASGAKPGTTVLFYGIGRERHRYWTTEVIRQRIVIDQANSGVVTADLGAPALTESSWVAIDLTTGAFGVDAPPGETVHVSNIPPGQLKHGHDGALSRLDLKATEMDFLWIRPGVGAWKAAVMDGGPFDADGEDDGHVAVSVDAMKPLGSSPATPSHFVHGDLLVAINPVTLEVAVVEVGQ